MTGLRIVMEVHRLWDNSPYCFFVHEQAKALVKRGHRVSVISPVMLPPASSRVRPAWAAIAEQTPRQGELDGVHLYCPRGLSLGDMGERLLGGRLLYQTALPVLQGILAREGADILHGHMIDRDGHCVRLLAGRTGLPYAVTGHGTDVLRYFVPGEEPWQRNRKTVQEADALLAVSPMLLERVRPYRDGGLTQVVPNGVDLSLVPDGSKRKSFSLLSVGILKKRKCMDRTLLAFSRMAGDFPEARLTLVGVGEMEQELRGMIKALGLSGRAELIAGEDHARLLKRMAETDVFVLPSWGEGFGVVYIEAMACGCIAVGARGEGIDGTIRDGENGFLVEAGNDEETEACLRRIFENRQAFEGLRRRGQADARAMTWDRNARTMEGIYEEMLRMRSPAKGRKE